MGRPRELIDQRFVRALAHPLRVAILDRMGWDKASPNTLSELLDVRLSNTAYHTRELEKLGVITLVDTAQRRGATEHFYRAAPDVFIGGKAWRQVPRNLRTAASAFSFDGLIERLIAALRVGSFATRDGSGVTWNVLTVDERGWQEVVALLTPIPDRLAQIHRGSVQRLGPSGRGISVVAGVLNFEAASPDVPGSDEPIA